MKRNSNIALASTGQIQGNVIAPDGITPLKDITVSAFIMDEDSHVWNKVREVNTDPNGDYTISELVDGDYRVEFSDFSGKYATQRYGKEDNWIKVSRIKETGGQTVVWITIVDGQTITGIDALLSLPCNIRGKITGPDGLTPLKNIKVSVCYIVNDALCDPYCEVSKYVNTDDEGNYNIDGLTASSYAIKLHDESGQYLNKTFEYVIELQSGETQDNVDICLSLASYIKGKVIGADDRNLLVNIEVIAFRKNDSRFGKMSGGWSFFEKLGSAGRATTDADGNYSIDGLKAGIYRIKFQDNSGQYVNQYYNNKSENELNDDDGIVVDEEITVTGIDASLVLASSIQGRITGIDGKTPLDNVLVTVDFTKDALSNWSHETAGVTYGGGVRTITDTNGNYSIGGLIAGSYLIKFNDKSGRYAKEYYSSKTTPDLADEIELGGNSVIIINTSLSTITGRIQGKVTALDGITPLNNIKVKAYVNEKGVFPVSETMTNIDGNYDIGGLAPATYRVGFEDEAGQYCSDRSSDKSLLDDIYVNVGETVTGIDASLYIAGHIKGKVTEIDGKTPCEGVSIYCYALNDSSFADLGACFSYHAVETDEQGNYDISVLISGAHRIMFKDCFNRYAPKYYSKQSNDNSANQIIEVNVGETVSGIDVSLSMGGEIHGRVTLPDKTTPVKCLELSVHWQEDQDAHSPYDDWNADRTETDENGNYKLVGLASGRYIVECRNLEYDEYARSYWKYDLDIVEGQIISVIDFSLALPGNIQGRVTDSDRITPLKGIKVSAENRLDEVGDQQDAETDVDGSYKISGLTAAKYTVHFDDNSGLYLKKILPDAIDLKPEETVSNLDTCLSLAGHIQGKVTSSDGITPLKDIRVFAWKGERYKGIFHRIHEPKANTDEYGVYDIGGLASGTYHIEFHDGSDYGHVSKRYLSQYYNNQSCEDSADGIAVTEGETITVVNACLRDY